MYFEFLMNMLELLQEKHIKKANDKDKRLGNSVGYRQVVVPFTVDNKLMELALQNTGVSMTKRPEKDHDKRIQFSVDEMPKVYQEYLKLRTQKNKTQLDVLEKNGVHGVIINELFYVDQIPYVNPTIYIDGNDSDKANSITDPSLDKHYKTANKDDFARIDLAYSAQLQEHVNTILNRAGLKTFQKDDAILLYCAEPTAFEQKFLKKYSQQQYENSDLIKKMQSLFPKEVRNKIEIAKSLEQFNRRKKELEEGKAEPYPVPWENWKIEEEDISLEYETNEIIPEIDISDETEPEDIHQEKTPEEDETLDLEPGIEENKAQPHSKTKPEHVQQPSFPEPNIDDTELILEAPGLESKKDNQESDLFTSESCILYQQDSDSSLEQISKNDIYTYENVEKNSFKSLDEQDSPILEGKINPNSSSEYIELEREKISESIIINSSELNQLNDSTTIYHDRPEQTPLVQYSENITQRQSDIYSTSEIYTTNNDIPNIFSESYIVNPDNVSQSEQYEKSFIRSESDSNKIADFVSDNNNDIDSHEPSKFDTYSASMSAAVSSSETAVSAHYGYDKLNPENNDFQNGLSKDTNKKNGESTYPASTSETIGSSNPFYASTNTQTQDNHGYGSSATAHVYKSNADPQNIYNDSIITDTHKQKQHTEYKPAYDDRTSAMQYASMKQPAKSTNTGHFSVNKEEATVYNNRSSFNSGKQYTAALSLLEAQKRQLTEILEQQEVGKGQKEVQKTISYLDATFGKAGLKQSFNKDFVTLSALSKNDVIKNFLANNNIKEYSLDTFDQVQNAINKSFSGTAYNKNVAKLSPKTMSVDQAAIFGGIAKSESDRIILSKFVKRHSNAADKKQIIDKIGLSKNISKTLQTQIRKGQSETTDSYFEVKGKIQEANAAKHAASKIMDAKFQLKGRRLEKKALKYNIKISKAQQSVNMASLPGSKVNPRKAEKEKAAIDRYKIRNERNAAKKKAYEEKKAEKQEKIDKMIKARNNGAAITKGEKKIAKLEKKVEYLSKRGNKKTLNSVKGKLKQEKEKQAKRIARKKGVKTFFENMKKNKLFKGISAIFKPLNSIAAFKKIAAMYLKTALLALGKIFAVLLLVLFIGYILLTMAYMMAGIWQNFSFDLTSIFDAGDDSSREETPMYKAYVVLDEAERIWVENFYNITNGTKNGDDGVSLDNYDTIDWDAELNGYPNCSYDAGKKRIKYDALGIGLMADISKVDGNVRVEFQNYTNPTKLTNLKDILALTTVYIESGYNVDNDFDEQKIQEMKDYWMQETIEKQYDGFSLWFKKVFQKNTANPILKGLNEKDSETLAYNVYALSLFQGSHDVKVDFAGIDTYPLKPYITDSRLLGFIAAGRLTDENGELFVCPSENGCQTASGFYFDDNGNVFYNNSQQIASHLIYVDDSERCYQATDTSHNRCWDAKTRVVPGGTDENGKKLPDKIETYYVHNCKGHTASYCGGHIHIDAVGIIHSIDLNDQAANANAQTDTQESFSENKTIFNENSFTELQNNPTEDIFEVDAKIRHAYIPESWGRWDAENKSRAIDRYSLNWTDFYNFPEAEDRCDADIFTGMTERDYNWGSGGSSLDYTKYTGSDVEIICQIIGSHEGQEGTVNPWDNNAISIGKLQWHGNRALGLLRDICKKNPTQANNILGNDLYHIIMNPSTDWSNKYFDVNKKQDKLYVEKLKKLLYTQESYQAQDELYRKDVSSYMSTVQSKGITDKAAVAYCSDIINQYGSIHSCHYQAILSHGGDLNAAYEYTVNYTCPHGKNYSKYINRRDAVKAQCNATYNS